MTAGTVSIDELVALCERLATGNHRLFERLGAWVSDEPDPQLQRWARNGSTPQRRRTIREPGELYEEWNNEPDFMYESELDEPTFQQRPSREPNFLYQGT